MMLFKPLLILPLALVMLIDIMGSAEQDIYQGLKDGDVKKIATYFADNVSITLKNETGYYSKFQSEMVLKEFLRNYRAVEVKSVPVRNDKQNYRTYEFVTSSSTFRVFVRFDIESDKIRIIELRIE